MRRSLVFRVIRSAAGLWESTWIIETTGINRRKQGGSELKYCDPHPCVQTEIVATPLVPCNYSTLKTYLYSYMKQKFPLVMGMPSFALGLKPNPMSISSSIVARLGDTSGA